MPTTTGKTDEEIETTIKQVIDKALTVEKVVDIFDAAGIKKPDISIFSEEFLNYHNKILTAKEVMGKDKLRELAVVLFNKVRRNASIDWQIKESARAKLRVIVKRTLRKYGYPPDMRKLATETVLKQAELIANELTKEERV